MPFSSENPIAQSAPHTCFFHSVKAISRCHIKDLTEDKLLRLARYLEKQLFKSSPNMQSYYNVYTIEDLVKEECTALAYRILASKKIQLAAKGKKSISKGYMHEAKLKTVNKGWRHRRMF